MKVLAKSFWLFFDPIFQFEPQIVILVNFFRYADLILLIFHIETTFFTSYIFIDHESQCDPFQVVMLCKNGQKWLKIIYFFTYFKLETSLFAFWHVIHLVEQLVNILSKYPYTYTIYTFPGNQSCICLVIFFLPKNNNFFLILSFARRSCL